MIQAVNSRQDHALTTNFFLLRRQSLRSNCILRRSPGVSLERVKILREGFIKAMTDPALLDETKKKRLEADPSPGDEVEALAKESMSQPPEIIEIMKKLLGHE